jgi:hypothetical protein
VGDAHYRLEVDIAGDQVTGFSRSFKLPEEWERAQEGRNLVNNFLMGVAILTLLALVAAALVVLVNLIRSGQMLWKRSAKWGAFIGVLGFLGALNDLPLAWRAYDTSMPLAVWKLEVAVSVVVVPIVQGLLAWLLLGSAASLYPDAWKLFSGAARRVWRRDAAVALVLSLAAGAGLARIDALLTSIFHAYVPIKEELFPSIFSTPWPAAGVFLSALSRSLTFAAVAGLALFIIRTGWKRRAWWLWLGLVLVLISLGPSHAHALAAFGADWVMSLLPLLMAALVVGLLLRNNILAYVVVIFGLQVADPLVQLFSQHNGFFFKNAVALALLTALVLFWAFWTPGGDEVAAGPQPSVTVSGG